MVPLLLPGASTGLSSIAAWCGSGATPRAAPGKFEVKRDRALSHSNDGMAAAPHGYFASNFASSAPRGQQWPPACTLPHVRDGLRGRSRATFCPGGRSSMRRPAHRQFLRNALPDLTTISPVTYYYRISYVRDTVGVPHAQCYVRGPTFVRSHDDFGVIG